MKLITFQPFKIKEEIEDRGIYYPPNNNKIGKRVFCLRLDKTTAERLYLVAPTMPQMLLTLEIDNKYIEEIDYIQWVNKINNLEVPKETSKYKEYCINCIKDTDVLNTQIICKSNDMDLVQDAFLNTHFKEIESLSGYKWKKPEVEIPETFWKSSSGIELTNKMIHCMRPIFKPLTEEFMDETLQLIREVFRI